MILFLVGTVFVTVWLLKQEQIYKQGAASNIPFITRGGASLYSGSTKFIFSGTNMHWLGLKDNNGGTYPTQFEIDDAMATAQELGATAVRSHTLGISVGCPKCIEPSLHTWNDGAFGSIDYAIASARKHNIRLIIPLTDNWRYYHGGKHTFTDWEHDSNEDDFYTNTNPAILSDFKEYISHVLTHVNQFTGIALKDDPTILAWETGNELQNKTTTWNDAWTQTIASYIKTIDTNHLVSDGHQSSQGDHVQLTTSQLQIPNVDMYSGHYYPVNDTFLKNDALLAQQANKIYYVGEYDWTDQDVTPAQATITQDKTTFQSGVASARIDITTNKPNPSDYYYVQLTQQSFSIPANTPATVSFYAKGSTANIVQVALQNTAAPYTVYTKQNVTLDSTWKQYSITYTPTQIASSVALHFNVASTQGSIWLDAVSVSAGGANLLTNTSFETTGASWLSPWTFKLATPTGDTLSTFLSTIESTPGISGDLLWEVYGHNPIHGYDTGDRYTLLYPGLTSDMKTRAQLIRSHAYTRSGSTPVPAHMLPQAPLLNSVTGDSHSISIDWRGSAGASSYTLFHTIDNGATWVSLATGLSDLSVPFTVNTPFTGSYKLVPMNLDGKPGDSSNSFPFIATPAATPTTIPTKIPTQALPKPTTTTAPKPIALSISSPLNNAKVKKSTKITLNSLASKTITKVSFYSNNTLVCTITKLPFTCSWLVPSAANKKYTFKAIGTSGKTTITSPSISVTSY